MRHGRVRFCHEGDIRKFEPIRRESNPFAEHKGLCACGVETSRYVTVGPPSDPRNGWQCRECGEADLRRQFDRAMRKPASPGRDQPGTTETTD